VGLIDQLMWLVDSAVLFVMQFLEIEDEEWQSRIDDRGVIIQKNSKQIRRNIDKQTDTQQHMNITKMSTSSASTLLDVATSYKASDVLDYTATHNNKNKPSSVIVVDSKMTPLEAATLLWENNM